jgi:hypothetical protein
VGWRCDLVVVDDASRSPQELLEGLVGGPLRAAGSTTLGVALGPAPPLGAVVLGGRTVLFLGALRPLIAGATPALEGRLARTSRGRPALALHLNSTSNAYGWRSWAEGRAIRARLGEHPDVLVDEGTPLRTEREYFAAYERRGDAFVDAEGERWTHDALGEGCVFALLRAATGCDMDGDLEREVTLFEADPESKRHTLQLEDEPLLVNPSADQVVDALRATRKEGPSFACLETTSPRLAYVQLGGSAEECVVEARFDQPDGSFRHLAAGRGGRRRPERRVPMSGGSHVTAPGDEVLTGADAERIFLQFLRDGTTCADYAWRDKTAELQT